MRRKVVYAAALGSPLVAVLIHALRYGWNFDAYHLSVMLGLAAFTWACNQFVLATHPRIIRQALGRKRLGRLHRRMALAILAAGGLHGMLKVGLLFGAAPVARPASPLGSIAYSALWGQGFRRVNPQVISGELGWFILLCGTVLTLLFIAPGISLRLRTVRHWRAMFFERTGNGYRIFRKLHVFWTALTLYFLLHAVFSSGENFVANPVGATWLLCYVVACMSIFSLALIRRLGMHPLHFLRLVGERIGHSAQRVGRDRKGRPEPPHA